MKSLLVKILEYILKQLARLTIWRYRPGVVGITGSVGKTSTKLAIAAVLGRERKIRWSKGNLNNELGLPLAILGEWSEEELALVSRTPVDNLRQNNLISGAGSSLTRAGGETKGKTLARIFFWLKVIFLSAARLVFASRRDYPEILILEYGADKPGDIKRLLEIARPNIGVLTAVGDVPVHVEFYAGPEEVAREKTRLLECLPSASFAILNGDDERVMNLSDRTRAHVVTFGFGKDVNMRIVGFRNLADKERPVGVTFKLEYGGSSVPVEIRGALGKSQAYAAAAAASVGVIFGMNLVKISEALREYAPAHGRMEIIPAVKCAYLIDDTYNASPLSMNSALETLKSLPAKRKIAVLGDMLELGKHALEEHQKIGKLAAAAAAILITVGPRAKFIAEGAKAAGMNPKRIQSFDLAEDARAPVQKLLRKGDLVLIKGSRAMQLEKVVEEIRAF
jgi:UDP-N-acetylmuramoyl-tripeptide--D-alanyl-D-alanine ligase